MIPRNPSSLFRSRWKALWWAAGVLVTTVMTVGFGPAASTASNASAANTSAEATTDVLGETVSDADLKTLAAVMNAD